MKHLVHFGQRLTNAGGDGMRGLLGINDKQIGTIFPGLEVGVGNANVTQCSRDRAGFISQILQISKVDQGHHGSKADAHSIGSLVSSGSIAELAIQALRVCFPPNNRHLTRNFALAAEEMIYNGYSKSFSFNWIGFKWF